MSCPDFSRYHEMSIHSVREIYDLADSYYKHLHLLREINHGLEPSVQVFFRGQSNAEWEIEPSINRCHTPESAILAQSHTYEYSSLFDLIAQIQHDHTGTRFIDFTTSIDVALFFACNNDHQKDGAVYFYTYAPHESLWVTTEILVETVQLPNCEKILVKDFTKYLADKYKTIRDKYRDLNELNMNLMSFLDHGFMVFPDQKSLLHNLKMQRQHGCFFVCGCEIIPPVAPGESWRRWYSNAGYNYFSPHKIVVPKSMKTGGNICKVIIPYELKSSIINQLSRQGVSQHTLFPPRPY
ncbi:MAG: FRG domain-containing protein [Clostridia bacterium]|nr:FRG domain-containing protein [Clostridia bacterium]